MSDRSIGLSDACIYRPIDSDAHEIRLLQFEPASTPYDLICCSLHVVPLEETPEYVVQVVENDNKPCDHVILCNDELLPVTTQVYSNLQRLVAAGWLYVWFNVLCIDHSNPEEFVQQSALLPDIYRRALHRFQSVVAFHYGPPPQNGQIRLLEILPVMSNDNKLRASLRIVSLEECPSYELIEISNVPMPEGAQKNDCFLICNGQGLRIDATLYQALERCRSSNHLVLWNETLCVNREDPYEVFYHDNLQQRIREQAMQALAVRRPEYQYRALASMNNEIRLLRIHPAQSIESPLLIEIFTASLDEKPDYDALSYVWGHPDRKCGILCTDGTIMRINKHLFLSLHELRQNSCKVVWADQICINQADNEERSQQVLMMNRIYKQATRVVAELEAFCNNPKHQSCQQDWLILLRILALTRKTLQAVRQDRARLDAHEFSKFGIPPLSHRSWKMFRQLRAKTWFSRSWVIQEAAACSNVWALCNRRLFRWDDMADANNAYNVETIPYRERAVHNGRRTIHNIDHLRRRKQAEQYTLLQLVSTFRNLEATDPRDKIYAFVGLASDWDKVPRPDYSQTVEEVYLTFARYFVSQGQGMELICEAGTSRSSLDTPSWAVDWSYKTDFYATHFSKGSNWTCLANQPRKMTDAEVHLTDDPSIISAKGIIVDTVVGTTPGVRLSSTEDSKFGTGEKMFVELDHAALKLVEQISQQHESRYGANALDAYASTIIGNDKRFADNARAAYEEAKEHLRHLEHENETGHNSDQTWRPKNEEYYRSRDPRLEERCFGVTQKGDMGLFPIPTEIGDHICVFQGCKAPFVLRKKYGEAYILIGDAYVHGLMQEDKGMEIEGVEVRTILLQ